MPSLDDERVLELTDFFKSLGDPTRVRILFALDQQTERNVSELACHLDITQSALSHQLRILRTQRLVTFRREGKQAFYSLASRDVIDVMQAGLARA